MTRALCSNVAVSGPRVTYTNHDGAQVSFRCADHVAAVEAAAILRSAVKPAAPKAATTVAELQAEVDRLELELGITPKGAVDPQRAADKARIDAAFAPQPVAHVELHGTVQTFGFGGRK